VERGVSGASRRSFRTVKSVPLTGQAEEALRQRGRSCRWLRAGRIRSHDHVGSSKLEGTPGVHMTTQNNQMRRRSSPPVLFLGSTEITRRRRSTCKKSQVLARRLVGEGPVTTAQLSAPRSGLPETPSRDHLRTYS